MADSSLDDFFAKKDKSKKKSKSSKLTPDDILSKTDEPVKKDKKSKKDKSKSQTSKSTEDKVASGVINPAEDAEWLEVEEEQEKDYTGLRIANLQVSEKQEDTGDEEVAEENEEEDEDGETKEKKDTGQQGPWKGTSAPVAPVPGVVKPPAEEPPVPKEDSTPKGPAKYIPPAQRAAAAAAARGESPATPSGPTIPAHLRGRKKAAPNLTSEEDFPTLGGGAPPPQPQDSDTRNFEKVQYGGRQMEDPTKLREQLSVANKYAALQD